jgi:hypothetical protein
MCENIDPVDMAVNANDQSLSQSLSRKVSLEMCNMYYYIV